MYSQQDEEKVILEWFNGKTANRFLDIGAFDGKTMSNTRRLLELGWAGIMVEPGAANFLKLIENCSPFADRCLLVQCAVDSTRGLAQLWFDTSPNFEWSVSISPTFAGCRGMMPQPAKGQFVVPTVTLADLNLWGPYDFISIDAEGKDVEILIPECPEVMKSVSMLCVEASGGGVADVERLVARYGFRKYYNNTINSFFVK